MATKNKKTLFELLTNFNTDQMVYLGTDKGSGWIAIDTVANILGRLDEFEEKARVQAENECSSAIARCLMLPKKIVTMQKELRKADEVERECIETDLYDLEQSYVAAFNTRKKWTKVLKEWVAFGDRPVVDVYMHETDTPGTCILVDGYLNGYLWWKDEKPSAEYIKSMCTDEE